MIRLLLTQEVVGACLSSTTEGQLLGHSQRNSSKKRYIPIIQLFKYVLILDQKMLLNKVGRIASIATNEHSKSPAAMELCDVQLRKMNVIHLVNKPYVTEVTLNEQNLYQRSSYSSELK